jgi:hypothetical protein
MPFYNGMLIDGDGATEESVGQLDPVTAEIVAADQAITEADRTIYDDQRDAAYAEYQDDIDRLTANMIAAQERAYAALDAGNMDRYNTWMASADRYASLMEIEGRILQSSLNLVDIRERSTQTTTGSTSGGFSGGFTGGSSGGSTGGNTGGGTEPKPPAPPPPPPPPPPQPIKTATPQYVLFNDDEIPVDVIVDLLFENIGGQELLSISRHDTVLGQNILYQPIKNLNILREEYNPNNLVRLQKTSDKFFANYTIKLSDKIPVVGNGANGDNVYLDSDGNLVLEFININNDEQIEVQITINGTIYEVGI